jgi:hypothetical protein
LGESHPTQLFRRAQIWLAQSNLKGVGVVEVIPTD